MPDTNCWIERIIDLIKLIENDRFQLEIMVALAVRHELEGLSKSERVADDAKKALELIRTHCLRCVSSKGTILQGILYKIRVFYNDDSSFVVIHKCLQILDFFEARFVFQ